MKDKLNSTIKISNRRKIINENTTKDM